MTPEVEIDSMPAATAADWLTVYPEDRHPCGFEAREPGLIYKDAEAGSLRQAATPGRRAAMEDEITRARAELADLNRRIKDLRTLEAEYRRILIENLEHQLRVLKSGGTLTGDVIPND